MRCGKLARIGIRRDGLEAAVGAQLMGRESERRSVTLRSPKQRGRMRDKKKRGRHAATRQQLRSVREAKQS